MPGTTGTSSSLINVAIGQQTLITQAALGFVDGDSVQITYTPIPSVFMIATIINYNAVTGEMTFSATSVSGYYGLQPVWNTQTWGSNPPVFNQWSILLVQGVPATGTAVVVPTILVRKLDSNWDPLRGQGLSNFITDLNAVAQILAQRLRLLQGEWFENSALGVPLFQSILGTAITTNGVALLLRQQILQTPYVSGILSFTIAYSQPKRSLVYTAVVRTAFGAAVVNG